MKVSWLQRAAYLAVTCAVLSSPAGAAEPNLMGQTGLISMPDATLAPDGTFRTGVGYLRPYQPWWFSFSLAPRLEFSGRYTTIRDVPGFEDSPGYGDFKDKSFDAKFQLLKEADWMPDVSVGVLDFTGTKLFSAQYLAMTKRLGPTEITLGYGHDRIDGLFGGIRYHPPWNDRLAFTLEYDANDYKGDEFATLSGADTREGGLTYGVSYRHGWLGGKVVLQDDDLGAMAYVSVPLMDREFIPKIHEPAPYTKKEPKVALSQWLADTDHAARIGEVLHREGYKDVSLGFDGTTLEAKLTNARISRVGRAVGRAARVLLLLGPLETEQIRITYTARGLPLVTYDFLDTRKLERYFDGMLSMQQLEQYMRVSYADPQQIGDFEQGALDLADAEEADSTQLSTEYGRGGHAVTFLYEDNGLNSFQLIPFNLAGYFNDPSGAFRYDLFATASYRHQLDKGLFLDTAARLTLLEDVSKISQESNSLLPHVRTDVAEYKKGRALRLERLLLNKLSSPRERVYSRISAGYYEEMYAGLGGQILYLPEKGPWALDLSVDWLKQRDFDGGFGFRDYSTVTALGALHYRVPRYGVTMTARAGRFLAGDSGLRFEIKRRFRSGVEFGGWYTVTDGNDITSPGTPSSPYYDKGIFLSIPLNSMLTKDTQSTAAFQLAPWTRDVGQMVASPLDLYGLVERPLTFGSDEVDLLTDFGQ